MFYSNKIAFNLIVFNFVFIFSEKRIVFGQSSCRTPDGEAGQCISLFECDPLLKLLNSYFLDPNQQEFLLNSQCEGGSGRFPHVCCKNGQAGRVTPSKSTSLRPVTQTSQSLQENEYDINYLLPDPEKYDCGVSIGQRIYGGQDADLDDFPWLALLEYSTRRNGRKFSCGGTLINPRYVVTAAHCIVGEITTVLGQLVNVRLGEHNTETLIDCMEYNGGTKCNDPPQDISVERTIVHPNYKPGDKQNHHDIALIRLSRNATFSEFVQPICLPNNKFTNSRTSEMAYVAGFGRTLKASKSTIKQKLAIEIADHQQCTRQFGEKGLQITDSQICAGGRFAEDTCQGDSGGPLMKEKAVWTLEGIVSYGNKCGLEGWPGIYTKVASYMPWIRNNLKP